MARRVAYDAIENNFERPLIETVPAASIAAQMTVGGHEPENPPTESSDTWRRSEGIGVAVSCRRRRTSRATPSMQTVVVASGSAAKKHVMLRWILVQKLKLRAHQSKPFKDLLR